MTRAQFEAECNTFAEVSQFCFDNDLESLIYDYYLDCDSVFECIRENIDSGQWTTTEQITDFLNGEDGTEDFYKFDAIYNCIEKVDEDDVSELKDTILNYHDDVFDCEDDYEDFSEDDYSDESSYSEDESLYRYSQLSSII